MKNLSSRWKYGLVAVLVVLGISSASSYYAGLTQSPIAQPKTLQTTSIDGEVNGAQAPTVTPTATQTPTETPTPTLIPTKAYIAPTTAYNPPTQAPANQTTSSELDNNNHYTNSAGNTVHSPANTTDGSVPAGASAQCADGTYSFSQSRRGTCSHHGGVAQWL
jgi:Protein of unknown function (DUF3761)